MLDKPPFSSYNKSASMGPYRISTGVLRHHKRGEPGNLVNCPNLNNKRQQKSCSGCLTAVPWLNATRPIRKDREPYPTSFQR